METDDERTQHRNKGVWAHSQVCVLMSHVRQGQGGRGRVLSYNGGQAFESANPTGSRGKRARRCKRLSLDGVGGSTEATGFGVR